ncbi:MAG: glycosyltransferase family 4 protein [Rubritepida sp.]|nr:glycosyltransferase family 4 protein [Rubritepida sp.]
MRVLEVTNVDFSLRHFLLPLMRAARARGHEVVGMCAEGPLLELPRAEGFRVIGVPMARSLSPRANLAAWRAIRAALRAERFDMVHAHMPISGLLARFAARAAGVERIAYTSHGFLFNQPGPLWRRALSLGTEWLGGRVTQRFLTVSEEEARDARRLWIHRDAVACLNGRDPALFRPDPAARARLRGALGLGAEDVAVIATARLVRHKGWPELLEAMAALPRAHLLAVGPRLESDHGESLEPAFARAAEAMGPRLHRLGYRDDVAALLAASDVFCLPSHFEGLPMSVIEAMLCGLPVVSTDIRGPREMVVEGETGFLVPPMQAAPLGAALARLAADPALRARMGAAGRARALERYTEEHVLARTLDLLGL